MPIDPEPADPRAFPRRVLLAVTGLSPQVVTETIYALAVTRSPPCVPTEVHLVSTAEGAREATLNLLSASPGWFHRLSDEYALPPLAFDAEHIHVLTDADGARIDDIRTPDHNRRAADRIIELVRAFTADPSCALHVSLAGGRKTMGYYAGYALSLFGRPQDRLSHVLVSEPFESSRDFYYPARERRVIATRGGRTADASQASVMLAEIPFVRLRHRLPDDFLARPLAFDETVRIVSQRVGPPQVTIDVRRRTLRAAGHTVVLPPAQFALYAVVAHRSKRGLPPLTAPFKHPDRPDKDWSAAFLEDLSLACGASMLVPDGVEERLRAGVDGDWFSQHLSRLNRTLRERLGDDAASYAVGGGTRRPRAYRLGVEPGAIEFDVRAGEPA
jgi:CRISPR-associated protein (TIGR02584 family)